MTYAVSRYTRREGADTESESWSDLCHESLLVVTCLVYFSFHLPSLSAIEIGASLRTHKYEKSLTQGRCFIGKCSPTSSSTIYIMCGRDPRFSQQSAASVRVAQAHHIRPNRDMEDDLQSSNHTAQTGAPYWRRLMILLIDGCCP